MPTYDYQCDACGHTFEAFQSMRDDPLSVCPECETAALRRLITGGTGVIFKGNGFYVNDSKRGTSSSAGTATTSSGAESTDSDGAAKKGSDGSSAGSGGDGNSGSVGEKSA